MLARASALARLTALASDPVPESGGIDVATATAAGYGGAATPLIALGAGHDPADQWVLQADPIHVEVGATDALLAARVDDLDADEAAALSSDIDTLTRGDSVRIVVPRPDRWLALARDAIHLDTAPVDAMIGRGLAGKVADDGGGHLPRDHDRRSWARLGGEIEMLLHDHPVNRDRRDRGVSTIDALWFCGGGRLPASVGALPAVTIDAGAGRAGDLARGLAAVSRSIPSAQRNRMTIAVTEPLRAEAKLDQFDRVLATGLAHLRAHRVDVLVLVADGSGDAVTWRVRAPSVLQRLSLVVRRPRFRRP